MLSYRHAYHAGGPADVLKHAVLAFVLAHATRKPAPLFVLDTHAGAAAYDLDAAMPAKLAEHAAGIDRVLAAAATAPALLVPYLEVVADGLTTGPGRPYPGSPELARALLRPGDRLDLVELHPTDHAALAQGFARIEGVRVVQGDGLAHLLRVLPPRERRAVVLIDPSYEIKADYTTVPDALIRACGRFAHGTFVLWYPVIERSRAEDLLAMLAASGVRRQLVVELCLRPDGARRGMTGFGLVVINPPWTLPQAAATGLPWLARTLDADGPWRCGWLVPE